MTRRFEPTSEHDRRLSPGVDGVLAAANAAGLVTAADVQVASRVGAIVGEEDEAALLALAVTTGALQEGSVCLDLDRVDLGEDVPRPDDWSARVGSSALAAAGVLRVERGLVYLDRYAEQEQQVAADLTARLERPAPQVDDAALTTVLDRLFGPDDAEQRAAARAALTGWTTVVTGGPGTGKTHTVARVLAAAVALAEQEGRPRPRVALAAPTAKAAARLREAIEQASAELDPADAERVGPVQASTLHRLLGHRRGSTSRFAHHRGDPLPHDLVVVDEASMLSLTMTARLLEAVRPQARLVLIGDPDQLASVEAGAVLADIVRGRPEPVAALTVGHRFDAEIGAVASAVRDGDADAALEALTSSQRVHLVADPWQQRSALVRQALDLRAAALDGDGPAALRVLDTHRLLCAHRTGPWGVAAWNRLVEQWLSEETGQSTWASMYPGRPVLVTRNDYATGLFNGDVGVVLRGVDGLRAQMSAGTRSVQMSATRLADVETMHAATVHKMQGSQVERVTLLLPELDSPLLTRELLYTAVTRAQREVTVVGTPEQLRAAVSRPVQRASGLTRRLTGGPAPTAS